MKTMSTKVCKYSDFKDDGYCLNNIKTKYRAVIMGDPATCLDTTEAQPCANCQLGEWYDVGTCTSGQQRRKRDQLTDSVNGGAKCSDVLERLVNCGTTPTVNSYKLGEGQFWSSASKAYTCLEACAYNFGGVPNDYQCSTSGTIITNMGYYDQLYLNTNRDSTWCSIQDEDTKRVDIYSCEDEGCSVSAYVSDHNSCKGKVNYCWSNVADL